MALERLPRSCVAASRTTAQGASRCATGGSAGRACGGEDRTPRAWGARRGGEMGMGADPRQHVVTIS